MSLRETNFQHTSTSSVYMQTFNDIVKLADTTKRKIERKCKKENYACLAIIGASENDKEYGSVQVGYRGLKKFIPKDNTSVKNPNPHIHMLSLSNPGESLARLITSFFTKKCNGEAGKHKKCNHYIGNMVKYLMMQSSKIRTVMYNVDQLPKEDVDRFCMLVEIENVKAGGVKPIFQGLSDKFFYELKNKGEVLTNEYDVETAESIDNTNKSENEAIPQKLQYNNIYNNISNYTTYTDNSDKDNLYCSTNDFINTLHISDSHTNITKSDIYWIYCTLNGNIEGDSS